MRSFERDWSRHARQDLSENAYLRKISIPDQNLIQELLGLMIGVFDSIGVAAGQTVFAVLDTDQVMSDIVVCELAGHHRRLFVRHVGVCGPVNHQRRRPVGSNILDRHEWKEFFGLGVRVPAADVLRPESGLAAVIVKQTSVAFAVP